MHHFFVESAAEGLVVIKGDDMRHAVRVLRIGPGEKVLVSDAAGHDYLCEAAGKSEEGLVLRIIKAYDSNHELGKRISYFQCLLKSDKMEWAIQKSVELGVSRIVPVESAYTVATLKADRLEGRLRRWQAVAESAAKQSGRSVVPEVLPPISFGEALAMMGESELRLIPYEAEEGMKTMEKALSDCRFARSVSVIIGPEGGFSPREIAEAKEKGVVKVSLGRRILRAETAAVVSLGLIMVETEIAESVEHGCD